MKAIIQGGYGRADVLEFTDIDPPVPDDEVLVRVHAASMDPGVWHLMTGLPYVMRVAGYAGTIEAMGADIKQFQRGDKVYGVCEGSRSGLTR